MRGVACKPVARQWLRATDRELAWREDRWSTRSAAPVAMLAVVMEPGDWNIVLVGAWNRAILTPAWCRSVPLSLPEASPVEVMVPLDGRAPFQVRDRGVGITPMHEQLLVSIEHPTEELLDRAIAASLRAVEDLPRTPLVACGINLRYSTAEPSQELLANTRCRSERVFAGAGFEVRSRGRVDRLTFEDGALNVIMEVPTTGTSSLTLNFEMRSSDRCSFVGWLKRPAAAYMGVAERVLRLLDSPGDSE
jgi:hypothetical protein